MKDTIDLSTEVHPVLTAKELDEIREFREKLAYQKTADCERLIYEWTRSGKLSKRQHVLLVRYYYQGFGAA